MKRQFKSWLKSLILEVLVYGVLVTGYYFLVLHYLGEWLHQLFLNQRRTYAAVALGLIIGQGFVLEALTRFLLGLLQKHTEE